MREILLKLCLVSIAIWLVGCGSRSDIIPDVKPVFYLVVPKTNSQWQREIISGFRAAAEQFRFDSKIVTYENSENLSLTLATIPYIEKVPICVVCQTDKLAGDLCKEQGKLGRRIVTLICDDPSLPRTAHVGMSPERFYSLWSTRSAQISQRIRNPLFLFGNEPIKSERITALIFKASDDWKKFRPTFRNLDSVTQEEAESADMVTAFGRDAVEKAKLLNGKVIFPVSLDDKTLEELKRGDYQFAIGPDYFQVGVRGFRVARDAYLQGIPSQPIIQLQYKEADKESVEFYKDRRYKVPPITIHALPKPR